MSWAKESLEDSPALVDNYCHIRPLAVRPLNDSERVPNPWGLLFSVPGSLSARGQWS